jgi:hypothetical protein
LVPLGNVHPQTSTLEGFFLSTERSLAVCATDRVLELMRQDNPDAFSADIRVIRSADGQQWDVAGVVIADDCAAIVEAKPHLNDDSVLQLESCLDFIE